MSLVLGLHLLKKLYLVSDTRVTKEVAGKKEFEDNQLKFEAINPKVSVVAAGNAHQAAYLVYKLRKVIGADQNILELRKYVETNIKEISADYLKKYGEGSLSVFIFTGFTEASSITVNSSTLGNVMSAVVKKYGAMQQSIDKLVTTALVSEISRKGILQKDDPIEVPTKGSMMFSLELDTQKQTCKIRDVECYEYAMFHPNYQTQPLPIPDETISLLEFRNIAGKDTESVLYEDAEILTNFVNKQIRENNFESVGGQIFPVVQSYDTGVLFPTGDLAQIKKGKVIKAGAIYVENGKICYELPDGTRGVYNKLEHFIDNLELIKALLHIK